jgi:hypothetical protein
MSHPNESCNGRCVPGHHPPRAIDPVEALTEARMRFANLADAAYANRHSYLNNTWAARVQREAEQGRDAIDRFFAT